MAAGILAAGTFVLLAFFTARALREWWQADRDDLDRANAVDDWNAHVDDAQRMAELGRHPITQRRSVAGLWRMAHPRDRRHVMLRLVEDE